MSLDIAIKVDPGNSVAAISKVEAELAKVEGRAIAASNAASTFRRIGEHMQFVERETAKARTAVGNLASGFKAVADHMRAESLRAVGNAFAGLTEQIRREADMLEKIRGPAREHMLDVEALEKLYKRGSITAAEYTEQLQKSGAVHGPVQKQAAEKGGFLDGFMKGGDAASELAGQLTAVAAPAALVASGIQAIGESFNNWRAREQDVRNATNSILKFHDSIESASAAMGEQQQLAEDLSLNIGVTTRAYADVREATENYGLSSKQVADITRNTAAAIIVDGGSIEQVSAIMEKLQYASEAGILTQGDLHRIFKQSPEIIKSFEETLHLTYPQLMKMATEGKITGGVIEKLSVGLGTGHKAMDKYKERLMSIDQVMADQHVGWEKAAFIIAKAKDGYQEIAETAYQAGERIALGNQHAIDTVDKLAAKLQVILTLSRAQGGFATVENLIEKGNKAQASIDSLKTPLEQYNDKLRDTAKTLHQAGIYGKAFNDEISRIHPPDWVDYYKQQLDAILGPTKAYTGAIGALDSLLSHHVITTHQYAEELGKVHNPLVHLDQDIKNVTDRYKEMAAAQIVASHGGMGGAAAAGLQGHGFSQVDRDAAAGNTLMDRGEASFEKKQDADAANRIDLQDKLTASTLKTAAATRQWKQELHDSDAIAVATEDSLKAGAASFSDTLVDAANGADVSWSKFGSNLMETFEKAIAKALILEAIGSSGGGVGGAGTGLIGALFGGANGFDARVPGGSGTFLPGFANGGDMLVGGSGGTDSKIAAFRVTPGETIHVRTPAQQQAMQSSAAQPVVNVHIRQDPRDLMAPVASGATDVHLNAWARRNVGLLRTILSK